MTSAQPYRAPRLLIVDDVGANREMLARRFQRRGCETVEAHGGLRALELIAAEPFDVVLLDGMMPDLDGREVLRRIRQTHSPAELPVIMVTARAQSEDVVEALSGGANDYITKPVDFAVAWARVEAQVGRKRAEEEARSGADRLRAAQRLEAVGQLAGGIAHDFNNLLLVIDGYARMALDAAGDPAAVARHLGEVLHATENAETLIKKLSVFSRRALVERRVVRLTDALDEVGTLLRPLLGARQPLALVVAPEAADLCVETDPAELLHALVNLAINARDAMPGGGTVTLRLDRSPNDPAQAELSVHDTGCGMAEDVQARIFDPFFTTKPLGRGTGLGLAMVYGFAGQSGGSVAVESEVGRGSVFRLRLPCTAARPCSLAAQTDADVRGRGETVLVVEDNDALLRLMQTTLTELGYRVMCASNGLEALELEAENGQAIDLLVSDVVMPSLGGFELAEILRESRPGLPMVFMSGYPTGGDLQSVSVPDDVLFLAKPFKPADLARAVREALAAQQVDRAA